MSEASKPRPGGASARPVPSRLDRLVQRARWVIGVERAWPALIAAAGIVALFVALAWLGVWVSAPRVARIGGVVLFGASLVAVLVWAARRLRIGRREALARLDRDSGQPHRPVSSAEDRLANAGHDPLTLALWDLSRRRLDESLARLRLARPRPRMVERDPYALRAAALLGLIAAGFVAGDHKDGLIAAAFDWRGILPPAAAFRVDAWVDPPGYTGRPPVVLVAGTLSAADQTVSIPIRSTIVVRSSGDGPLDVVTKGALKPIDPSQTAAAGAAPKTSDKDNTSDKDKAAGERRFALDGNGRLVLSHGGQTIAGVTLTAIPDLPPTITLTGPVRPTARGGMTLAYKIDDDYGVTGAEAAFTDPVFAERPLVRSLVPPPKLALNLPPTPGGLGAGQTTGDLSDHPWAGAEVIAVLSTKDEGGNVGLSPPVRITLPARPFGNPLARALVEQRRNLVFDPDHHEDVSTALDALMIDPDRFGTTKAVYLGLYTARQRLAAARNDDDLIALSDYLWQMALRIEEGDKSQAARDLQAAEQALREALQRGASPDEIKKLTEQLRQQMQKFLAEMSRNAQSAQNQAPDPNARTITQEQLQQMMQRMEEMARNGDTAEAQRLLDQLQNMLDNLKTARNGSQGQRQMNQAMSELDKMSRDQQALRDKTFKNGQPQDGLSSPGEQDDPDSAQNGDSQPQDGQPQAGDSGELQKQQKSLRDRLDDLQQRMRQLGLKGEKGLEDAEQAMKDAEGALGEGKPGSRRAVDAQGRALQGLQQGSNGLAQQMAQAQGQGQQQGQGDGQGGQSISQGSAGQDGNDPLGRPRDGRGTMETRGRPVDDGVAARAARVLQELRRRLGDPSRPSEEMNYLERLLQRY